MSGPLFYDRVKETTTTTGTGTITLAGAVTGYQSFAAVGDANTCYYCIAGQGTAEWEVGLGTYTASGTTLARTAVLASSNSGSAVSFSAGTKDVFLTRPGKTMAVQHVVNGRLTLTSGVPVTTADVTGAATVYLTPFRGNIVTLWDGNAWLPTTFVETSLALGTGTNAANYDVFGYLSSGVLALEKLAWLNATATMTIASPGVVSWTAHGMSNGDPIVFTTTGALPTGITANTQYWVVNKATDTFQVSATVGGTAINTTGSQSGTHTGWQSKTRGTAVTLQDGRYCKSGDKTRLYLGTFRTTATTTTEDSDGGVTTNVGGKRFLWNYYNRVQRQIDVIDTTDSWTYNVNAVRQARANAGNQVEFVVGIAEDAISAILIANLKVGGGSNNSRTGIGMDSITAVARYWGTANSTSGYIWAAQTSQYGAVVPAGYHYLAWLEAGNASAAATDFFGDNGAGCQSGLSAIVVG